MADSQIGVFLTRSLPNLLAKPSVILKTPPYSATSCPIIIRLSYLSIDSCNPFDMASINLIFDF